MLDLSAVFEDNKDEYLQFEEIGDTPSERPDLVAFLLLEKLCPSSKHVIAAAEHDEIYLGIDLDDLSKVATEEDIITLIRCGVMFNKTTNSLMMFV